MGTGVKVLIGAVLIIGTFLTVVGTVTARESEVMMIELASSRVLTFCGLVITVVSALFLVGMAIGSKSLEATLPLTVPAVIGLFLVSPHWSIGLFLCVVAAGYFALQFLRVLRGGSGGKCDGPPEPPS